MSRGWAKASACRLQMTLSCAVLYHIVSLQYLSRSSLHRLAGLPCRLFLSYGLQVVTREVHPAIKKNIKRLSFGKAPVSNAMIGELYKHVRRWRAAMEDNIAFQPYVVWGSDIPTAQTCILRSPLGCRFCRGTVRGGCQWLG